MNRYLVLGLVLALCALAAPARADWDPSEPTKWVQPPDPNGWDVNVTTPKLLADDFLCRETNWISDIHLWGSWGWEQPGVITRIHLSIHDDVPAGLDTPWSHPGRELWSREIDPSTYGGVVIGPWGTGVQGWYDPNTGEAIYPDHYTIWQVNVFLKPEDWFLQQGSDTAPIVYWLDVQVDVDGPTGMEAFGWKTSIQHWNDDAVWADWLPGTPKPVGDQWQELRDPFTGQSLDLAFAITTTPVPEPGLLATGGLGLLALLTKRRTK